MSVGGGREAERTRVKNAFPLFPISFKFIIKMASNRDYGARAFVLNDIHMHKNTEGKH